MALLDLVPPIWPLCALRFLRAHGKAPAASPPPVGAPHWRETAVEALHTHLQFAIWAIVAYIAYLLGPSVEAAQAEEWLPWAGRIVARDMGMCVLFYGGWHTMIAHSPFSAAIRPHLFAADLPSAAQTRRDCFLTLLGVLHGSVMEIVLWRWWARSPADGPSVFPLLRQGGLRYYPDFWRFPVWSVFWMVFVPYWREVHFYWSHRMMHPWRPRSSIPDVGKFLYRYVHSLHHRSSNPNTWNGMGMHPLEHLAYFSCAWLVPLAFTQHPLPFLFNKWHLYCSPITGGHDGLHGFFHWLHHAHFECNYGAPGIPFDRLFGTFEDGSRWEATRVAAKRKT
eukprot:TRINITY_DN59107_c0_g1_i1.p1 TRINITY_DN59107_c0_g1~~TRINITY_DN59107_c0_g1_i1.p1  ORF type:complete len:346 (-),score=30.65 TRINITY_DN59107_c0_g1_i1:110-1120(-)